MFFYSVFGEFLVGIYERIVRRQCLGGDGGSALPLSIPNREVKPTSAENTGLNRENRSPPGHCSLRSQSPAFSLRSNHSATAL
jgi:hypothetical protein